MFFPLPPPPMYELFQEEPILFIVFLLGQFYFISFEAQLSKAVRVKVCIHLASYYKTYNYLVVFSRLVLLNFLYYIRGAENMNKLKMFIVNLAL